MEIKFVGNQMFNDNRATIEDVVAFCKTQDVLGLDIETSRKFPKGQYRDGPKDNYKAGLDPYLSRIVMIQTGTLDKVFVIDARAFSKEALKPFTDFLNWNNDVLFVGHNIAFEGKHLRYNYGIRLKKVWDTMLCEINLTNGLNLKYGLADLAERYLGAKKTEGRNLFTEDEDDGFIEGIEQEYIDKSTRLGFINIGDAPFTESQILYGADDIRYPLMIREKQLQNNYNPVNCHLLENSFSQVLADLELTGLRINTEKWLALYEKNLKVFLRLKGILDGYVVNNIPAFTGDRDLFNPDPRCTVQWSSSRQVIKLFRYLGFCPKEKSRQTKKMEWSVGDRALTKLLDNEHKVLYYKREEVEIVDRQSLILMYLLYKKYEQLVTTFGKDFITKYVHPITGRVHSSFRQILNTGRMSSTRPNQQNIPGSKGFRDCFDVPVGTKLVNADYSSQEIRILAQVSGSKEMQDFFRKGDPVYGEDFHSWVANKAFKIIYNDPTFHVPPKEINGKPNPSFKHKKERDTAKNISFKISYGGSAFTMKDEFGVTEEEAQVFIDGWFQSFPGLEANFEKTRKEAVENGYIVIDQFTNRVWFFDGFNEMTEAKNEALSYYPPNYKHKTKEEKERWKEGNKHLTGPLWKTWFTLKSSLERKGLNYRIQGNAGGMMKMAAIQFRKWLIEEGITYARITNIVHDEVLVECVDDPEKLDIVSRKLEDCMKRAGAYFCKDVPMEASAVTGDVWAH